MISPRLFFDDTIADEDIPRRGYCELKTIR